MHKQQTHTIIGQAHIEGTQRGFVVWVETDKRRKAQLTDANPSFEDAVAAANSIDRGRWVARRKGGAFNVNGRVLTVSWWA